MKLLNIFTPIIFFMLFQLQDSKLKGRYIMEYEENFNSENCIIKFNDHIYERHLVNGKIVKGKIEYSEQKVFLNDKKTSLQMEFYKDEMRNDTIYFKTKDLKKVETNNKKGAIVIYSGKLIRMK